ncbi:hypothetical protein GIB67_006335 [Kingdonia uniflora]|uniref:BZIP domain-containing protein n=1 Tax=Kingdonia uniflora TaxID=39325 RepID=A0A7J7P0I4_9MAGN|nr:hypothetical protein GIB67_006335 [Kingdonia uniflora]
MGNSEGGTPPKSEKPSSPPQEEANIHAYPNWAAIQAYYMSRPGVPLPPPYFNSAGHPPHPYIWGTPQHMMPPYGPPYGAIYPHGGVYAHPSASFGSQSQSHGSTSSPAVCEVMEVTPLSIATPAKSSNNKDRGLMKKLKGLDGLAVGNGSVGSAEASQRFVNLILSSLGSAAPIVQNVDRGDCRTDDSSDGSDGNTAGGDKKQSKRLCKGALSSDNDEKIDAHATHLYGEVNSANEVTVASPSIEGKQVGTVSVPSGKSKTVAGILNPVPDAEVATHNTMSSELWIKDERELKREKRKQSNRESARRSRLRKQAETEQLAVKVESLSAENVALKSELDQLTVNSEKLRIENAALMEKLKNAQFEPANETVPNNLEIVERPTISTENFLSKVNNSIAVTRSTRRDNDTHENSNPGAKLHQLLESSPRADVVAAG